MDFHTEHPTLSQLWPPFGLEVVAYRDNNHHDNDQYQELRLRIMRDDDIVALNGATPHDIYGPDIPPYAFPWLYDADPLNSARFRWQHRIDASPQEWSLDFVVAIKHQEQEAKEEQETIIGVVDCRASNFATTRQVSTGSWIYYDYQGCGYGTLMREAIADFCFDHLHTTTLHSAWHPENAASARVSEKLGYQTIDSTNTAAFGPNGVEGPLKEAVLRKENYKSRITTTVTGCTTELRALLGADEI
ncbi:GNAT family N-acetyltransferase [Corynebacterium camporealensis]